MEPVQLFKRLSAALTGYESVSDKRAEDYYTRLINNNDYKNILPGLLQLPIDKEELENIMTRLTPEQLACCRSIVFLWYTSELPPLQPLSDHNFPSKREAGSQEEYYDSLIWKVIRAHPPGLSGGYYGYWKYQPEN